MNRNRMGIQPIRTAPAMSSPQVAPMLRQTDQAIMQNGNRLGGMLGQMPMRRADGGKVSTSIDAMKLVKDAIDHLRSGDTSSAKDTLRSINDPEIQSASQDLNRGPGGVRLAIKKLESLVESLSNQDSVPMLKKGGPVKK